MQSATSEIAGLCPLLQVEFIKGAAARRLYDAAIPQRSKADRCQGYYLHILLRLASRNHAGASCMSRTTPLSRWQPRPHTPLHTIRAGRSPLR